MNTQNHYRFIGPFKQLLSLADLPLKGALKDADLELIAEAGMILQGDKIYKVGLYSALIAEAERLEAEHITLEGDYVALPGFVDAHTHIAFAGTRSQDFALRNQGSSYLEIAAAGGGIWSTVKDTRQASLERLKDLVVMRAKNLLNQGVTTIEVKSGYGLNIEEELKMLRAIKAANAETPADLLSTCLAAHTLPRDFEGTHEAYLAHMAENLFPILKAEDLTQRIDAFVEQSAFSADHIRPYYKKAREMGFDITIHADQFSPIGTPIAVEFKALSADHLESSGEHEIALLAQSDVIAMALPGASLGIGCAFTPARKLLDAGCSLAIATDWNPGSAPMGNLMTQASILASYEKLSNAEVLAAITFRAAAALNLKDRGRLQAGMKADFNLYKVNNYQEITYLQGQLLPAQVWKDGTLINQD